MIEPHSEVHGEKTLPPLLLVHGFLSSRAQWRANIDGLMTFCRPIIVELWGHGRSPAPEEPALYQVGSYVAFFETLRARLGVDRWFLCGQSFGAGLTIRYALTHADRVAGQIFTNSVSGLSAARGSNAQRNDHANALERGGPRAIEALTFHPRHARRLPPDVKAEMLEDAKLLSPRGVANAIRYTVPNLSVTDAFAETRVPTLLLNGTWDKAFQPLRQKAAELLPALRVVDLEGGHSINAEVPERFNEEVRTFLENCM